MTPEALGRLAALTEARRDRDLARLEALMVEDRGLAEEIMRLAAVPAQDMAAGGTVLVPLVQQALRAAWVEQHITRARRRRGELAGEIAAARAAAASSVGRHAALDRLATVAQVREVARRLAMAEREAPPVQAQGRYL